jgi:DNA-directed RNA polymerase subunit D
MMKVDILENEHNRLGFKLSGVGHSFANSVRRAAINSVDCFAIDTITFYENTSSMFDEYLAHRIGLVPITTPSEGYDRKDEIVFKLEAEGPVTVYSKDLIAKDKKVKVANENIPIIKLAQGQKLSLEGKAVMNNAAKSSKFQPGLVTYKAMEDEAFQFYIESFGQMPPKQILRTAIDGLKKDMKVIYKELK